MKWLDKLYLSQASQASNRSSEEKGYLLGLLVDSVYQDELFKTLRKLKLC